MESVVIPASVKEIGMNAFSNCKNLKSVTFAPGSRLEKITAGCFYQTSIEKIVIPKGVA